MQYLTSFYKSPNYIYKNSQKYAKMIYSGAAISSRLFPNFKLFMDADSMENLFNGLETPTFDIVPAPIQDKSLDFFWAYSKILSNLEVKGPFCNIDSDLFIWDKDAIKDGYDFFFYSKDEPNSKDSDFVNPFYTVGYRILKNAGALPSILDGTFDNMSPNFPIYNFGITKCNNFEIYEYYYDILSEVLKKADKISKLVNERKHPLAYLGSSTSASTCVTTLLEQALLSKIIYDKNLSVSSLYPSYSHGQYFPVSKDDIKNVPATHLMHRKYSQDGQEEINALYSNIINGDFNLFKITY